LANTQDTNYRAIDDDFPVFGFAVDMGKVPTSSVSTLFQLSLHQENCVQFEGANGIQSVPCMWTSYFSDETSAVSSPKLGCLVSISNPAIGCRSSTSMTTLNHAAARPALLTIKYPKMRSRRAAKTTSV
jgi:hypothetical protein